MKEDHAMKLKKIIAAATAAAAAFVFTACSIRIADSDEMTEKDYALEKQEQVLECFEKQDKKELKALFCRYVIKNDEALDEQIDEALDFIDGKIVSHGDTKPSKSGDEDKMKYSAYTQKVTTESGREYKISFEGWYEYREEPDKLGITRILVIDTSVEVDPSKTGKDNGIYSIGLNE